MTALVSHKTSGLKGVARVPGDKSISHRSLMIGALAHGETIVQGLLEGEDVFRTAQALLSMGALIIPPDVTQASSGVWRIQGLGDGHLRQPRAMLDLGNSGTSARLLMGLVAGYSISATFTGDASLVKRPMGRVIKPLSQMGARFEATSGDKLPLRVTGNDHLRPIHYTMPVASAQVKSAIILAALHADGETVITEPVQTRDHSERMLSSFGADIRSEIGNDGAKIIRVQGHKKLSARQVMVPSDPSSAAFLVVAALLSEDSDILIPNVLINPLRTGLYDTLKEMGADISFEEERLRSGEPVADIRVKSSRLKGVTVPVTRVASMIDEFPILSVAAACADGTTRMSGLEELRVKESDRLAAIANGLTLAGVKVEAGADTLDVFGNGKPPKGGCRIETNLDHRIAMSFLVLGGVSAEPISIDDSDAIATSFPGFVDLMTGLGAKISPVT